MIPKEKILKGISWIVPFTIVSGYFYYRRSMHWTFWYLVWASGFALIILRDWLLNVCPRCKKSFVRFGKYPFLEDVNYCPNCHFEFHPKV